MKKIHAIADYGFVGTEVEEEFEFEDDVTEEEIEEEIWEWACEQVSISWEEEE